MRKHIQKLKEAGQDFEFYPTTDKMLEVVAQDMLLENARNYTREPKVLDIGAGNGKALDFFLDKSVATKAYAIEKADLNIRALIKKDIPILGTDFEENTLIDKDVNYIFCNPPYSKYEDWTTKIIEEGKGVVYLVIPQRWKKSEKIKQALLDRLGNNYSLDILYTGDFLEADRVARAKVDIVKIKLIGRNVTTPDDLFFSKYVFKPKGRKNKQNNALLEADSIKALVSLYNKELSDLISAFEAISTIDTKILSDVGINYGSAKEAFYSKINGLKLLYWNTVFKKVDSIKRYLTTHSIRQLWDTINHKEQIDFTESNIYTMVIYFLEKANNYKDRQLIQLFDKLFSEKNVKGYKSNKKMYFTYNKWDNISNNTHYYLTNKIVLDGYYAEVWYDTFKVLNSGLDLISDIITVAYTVGYDIENPISDTFSSTEFEAGVEKKYYLNKDYSKIPLKLGTVTNLGKIEESFETEQGYQYKINSEYYNGKLVKPNKDVMLRVKFYKNGNCHINFNKKLMDTLNINFARLKGWIRTPQEAKDEMGIDIETANTAFKALVNFSKSSVKLLN